MAAIASSVGGRPRHVGADAPLHGAGSQGGARRLTCIGGTPFEASPWSGRARSLIYFVTLTREPSHNPSKKFIPGAAVRAEGERGQNMRDANEAKIVDYYGTAYGADAELVRLVAEKANCTSVKAAELVAIVRSNDCK